MNVESRIGQTQNGLTQSGETHNGQALNWRAISYGTIAITTIFRILLVSRVDLVPDEAYYWDWSRHLSLGYYDQGPFIAYLIRATTVLFGTTEFGVRIGVVLCSLGTIACAERLASRIYSPLAGFITTLLLVTCPLTEVGSLIATYDPPLVFFWTLTAVFLDSAIFAADVKTQNRSWIAAGIAAGFGLLSKHTMVFAAPCLLLFFALAPSKRFWLRRPQPYTALGIVVLLYGGVIYWNSHHHWWTFGHLLYLTHKSSQPVGHRIGDYLGSQIALVGPGLFVGTIMAASATLRFTWLPIKGNSRGHYLLKDSPDIPRLTVGSIGRDQQDDALIIARLKERAALMASLGLPVFVFFLMMTLKAKVQGNWAVCAWVTPSILLGGWLAHQFRVKPRLAAACTALNSALGMFVTCALLSTSLRTALGVKLPPDADISNSAFGWRELAKRVQCERQDMARSGRPVFLAANGYQYTALLAFYLPDHPATHDMFIHNRLTMYAAGVEELKSHLGEDAIYVNDNRVEDPELRIEFSDVEWQPPLKIYRPGAYAVPIHEIQIARCHNYRRYMGIEWADGG